MMMSDSYNHIFGQSVNSLNTNLISGGSSGGEAALVGCAGSPIGIGTDIGGSIRIPAALQGLYSLMPCVGRQPYHHKGPAQKTIISVAGPFARDIENLEIYMQALEKAEPWTIDPQCVPVPWRRELATVPAGKKLRIGYVVDDGMVKCQPPIERTMRETIEKLKKEGHELFEWDTSSHAFGYQIWLKAILADGGAGCAKLCAAGSQPLIQGMLVGTSDDLMTPSELHELNHLKQEFQRSYLARWNDMEADALILPVTPWVGYTPKTWVKSSQNVGYTALYNLLNYAAVTVPVGVVEAGEAGVDAKGAQDWNAWRDIKEWRSESDRFNWEQCEFVECETRCRVSGVLIKILQMIPTWSTVCLYVYRWLADIMVTRMLSLLQRRWIVSSRLVHDFSICVQANLSHTQCMSIFWVCVSALG